MKKIFITAAAGMLCLFISCKDSSTASSGSTNDAGTKAKANNRAVLTAIENGDVSKLDSLITKDAIDHSGGADGTTEIKGLDNIKAELSGMKKNFKELHFDVMQEATNADYLFTLGKMTGTSSAASNQKIETISVDVLKFNSNGMLTEHWSFNDPKDMKKMAGDQHMENMPGGKMDSTMKK